MKLIILLALFFSVNAFSDLGVSCGNEMVTYKHVSFNARFDACPAEMGNLNIYAKSVGGNYHTCNFEALAIKTGNTYAAVNDECEISFVINGNELTPKFSKKCISYCGARSIWEIGKYVK